MLKELMVENFALIERQAISFGSGLTILTGETGAGKSIIIDAIQILTGGRGSTEFIRHGQEKASIEGLFQFAQTNHPALLIARENDIPTDEQTLIFRRDLSLSGKSICKINGKMVTLSLLKEIGRSIIDIHGQHEHQNLMDQTFHLPLLDQFAGNTIIAVKDRYQLLYHEYRKLAQEMAELNENDQQIAHRFDLLQFQYQEISQANLIVDEDEKLIEERDKLTNYEKITFGLQNTYRLLKGERQSLDLLRQALLELADVSAYGEEFQQYHAVISSSFYELEEVASAVDRQLDQIEFDEGRLNYIETRLSEINQLKKKYGVSIEEILNYAEKIAIEIDNIQNRESRLANLEKQVSLKEIELNQIAEELSSLRKEAGQRFTKLVQAELQQLYLENAIFDVHFELTDPNLEGIDEVEFYISTNIGEPLKPLIKTASGGELSRIMLAMKNIFSKYLGISSIIFDEIDTGVSGRVAQAIAEKIFRVSLDLQVLCISHLPQVASMANTHLYISKKQESKRTITNICELTDQERVEEIARMISGSDLTVHTANHVRGMLQQAKKFKQSLS